MKTVRGSWIESSTCDHTSPANVSWMKRTATAAAAKVPMTPQALCWSLMS